MSKRSIVLWLSIAGAAASPACGKSKTIDPSTSSVHSVIDAEGVDTDGGLLGVTGGDDGGGDDAAGDGEVAPVEASAGPDLDDASDASLEGDDASDATSEGGDPGDVADDSPTDVVASEVGGRDTPADDLADDLCSRYCAVLSTLPCPPNPSQCLTKCAAALAGKCGDLARLEQECVASRSLDAFACDSRGRVNLIAPNCTAEDAALLSCLIGG